MKRPSVFDYCIQPALFLVFILGLFLNSLSFAGETVCAEVKIEIAQELSFERQAFDARMRINNGYDNLNMEQVDIDVFFEDRDGNPVLATSDPNNTTAKFFIRVDEMDQITNISGSGVVAGGKTATIHWLIIPTAGAGGNSSTGLVYFVGAQLSYRLGGETVTYKVVPDFITVRPQPKLVIDYFLPADVYGDNPLTTAVEAPQPFGLGVRIKNVGYATANNVAIDSGQPKIVEDRQGLLVGFQIKGSQVNGAEASPNFKVNFGDIPSGGVGVARWIMEASMSGRFEDFGASFSHADDLGGKLTSLIETVTTHRLIHEVLVDQPGRDAFTDFLATNTSGAITRVFESGGQDTDVQDLSGFSTLSSSNSSSYTITHPPAVGFVYLRVLDPKDSKMNATISRSDGKILHSQNAWTSAHFDRVNQKWEHYLSVFDESPQNFTYTVTYTPKDRLPNLPPVIAYLSDKLIGPGDQVGFIVRASDPNGSPVTLSSGQLPFGASFADQLNGVGVFLWTPSSSQTGTYPLDFIASDGQLITNRTVKVTIGSAPPNRAPMAQSSTITPTEDIPYRGFLPVDDPDGDALTYNAAQPSHGVLELLNPANGEFRFIPTENFAGTDAFAFGATDGSLSANGLMTIEMRPVNDAPTVETPLPDQETPSSEGYSYVLPSSTFSDPDGDTLSFSAVDLPAWLAFNPTTGTFSGTPDSGDVGVSTVRVTATDPSGQSAQDSYTLTVIVGADGQILGVCFNDLDGDGLFDTGEPGLQNLAVFLDLNRNGIEDANEPKVTTDAQGNFALNNLAAGTYVVRDQKPAEFTGILPADAHFSAEQLLAQAAVDGHLASGDLNADGLADLVLAQGTSLKIFKANASGIFSNPVTHTFSGQATAIVVADLNEDGAADAVVATSQGSVLKFMNNGLGSLGPGSAIASIAQPSKILAGLFNDDNLTDLAIIDNQANLLHVLHNSGNASFSAGPSLDPGGPIATAIVTQLDSQFGNDLVAAQADRLMVFMGLSGGGFSTPTRLDLAQAPATLLNSDLDGNGIQDLVVSHTVTGTLSWFAGLAAGEFAAPELINIGQALKHWVALDGDGDGKLDLVGSDGNAPGLVYLQNGGFGQFRDSLAVPTSFVVSELLADDLDADGDKDLVFAGPNGFAVASNNATAVITLAASETANMERGSVPRPGSLEGTVFVDENENGAINNAEPSLSGWTVFLDMNANGSLDSEEPVRTTNAAGVYRFADLPENVYRLTLVLPNGWSRIEPANGYYQAQVTTGETTQGLDFGVKQIAVGDLLVGSLLDGVDAAPGDGLVATTSGLATLRAAIMEANALPGANRIVMAAGTYVLSLSGNREDLGASGDFDIRDNLELIGAGADVVIINGASLDRVFHVLPGVEFTLKGLTVTGGNTGADGAGLENNGGALLNGGTVSLLDVALSGNLASNEGGAAFNSGSLTLERSTLAGNVATDGAGLATAVNSTTNIANTTFSGNAATNQGGAIFNRGSSDVWYATATSNSAALGGGFHNVSSMAVGNSIIAGNTAALDADVTGTYASNGGNLIGDRGEAQGFNHGAQGDLVGTTQTPLPAGLGAFGYYGGTTQTYLPTPTSPVIDAALPNMVFTTDQRGLPRFTDGNGDTIAAADMGAVEWAPSLTLAAPNGGEVLQQGQPFDIRWQGTGLGASVKIENSNDNGATWETIVTETPNDGVEAWTPAAITAQGLVRITTLVSSQTQVASAATFTVQASKLVLTYPNGGETLTPGDGIHITWTAPTVSGLLKLELSRDGGSTWELLNNNVYNDGEWTWSAVGTGTTNARFRISSILQPSLQDTSNGNVTIKPASLVLATPNGGETYTPGDGVVITWASQNFLGGVKVELSRDNGTTWEVLMGEAQAAGSHTWTASGLGSTTARVRISSVRDPSVMDVSNATFTVKQAQLTLVTPNGGEVLTVGDGVNVSWTGANFLGTVRLEVSRDGGATWASINDLAVPSGNWTWSIKGQGTQTGLIRVISQRVPGLSDVSNAVFTIKQPTLSLTSLNGGETLTVGDGVSIGWSAQNFFGGVKIELSRDNGVTWEVVMAEAMSNVPYTWLVRGQGSTNALIKISAARDSSLFDISNAVFTIKQPVLTLTSPNGGENYTPGDGVVITWTAQNFFGGVKVELSRDNGTTWELLMAEAQASGSHTWVASGAGSTTSQIRLSATRDPGLTDTSNAAFTIKQSQLTVTSPNGGEVLTVGDGLTFTWTGSNFLGVAILELSRDNGLTWESIHNSVPISGSFQWTVKGAGTTTALFRVRSARVPGLFDVSNAVFTIKTPTLTLNTPNGGETLIPGDGYSIGWTAQNFLGGVKVELSRDNGTTWEVIMAEAMSSVPYTWQVRGQGTTTGLIRISSARDPGLTDTSNAVFNIKQSSLVLNTPNGGDVLTPGDGFSINWSAQDFLGGVKIELSRDGGLTWEVLIAEAIRTTPWTWLVRGAGTVQGRIRVSSTRLPEIQDVSEADFTIKQSSLTLTGPNGGETLFIGTNHSITWNAQNFLGGVKVELSRDGGTTWELIHAEVPSGTPWTITVSGPPTAQGRVRISSPRLPELTDTSEANFTIQ